MIVTLVPSAVSNGYAFSTEEEDVLQSTNRIHVLAFSYADAILIESNGQFGLIDSGDDTDSPLMIPQPNQRYPLRDGLVIDRGTEDELLEYLDRVGVTSENLAFVVGTHAHCDHIGAMDTVIRKYHPRTIYTPYYSDALITNPNKLWDNQYVYDEMMAAAYEDQRDYGATIIQDLTSNPDAATFTLGSARIRLFENVDNDTGQPVSDGNFLSWSVEVTMSGHNAYLAGDLSNYNGAEDYMATQLSNIDFIKLGHHGNKGSNTPAFLESIMSSDGSDTYAVQTGYSAVISEETGETLDELGVQLYATKEARDEGVRAIVADFWPSAIYVNDIY